MIHRILICALALFLLLPLAAPRAAAAAASRPLTVNIPPQAGDGTAFPCTFSGEALAGVTLTFMGQTVTAQSTPNAAGMPEAAVLLPVPLDKASGPEPLAWSATFSDGATATGTATLMIQTRAYPVQKLTLAPKYVTPDPSLEERIRRERGLMQAALTTRSPVRYWELPMFRPVPGKITSLYGLRRVLNGQPRAPHRGLDFRAALGTPIRAVADGVVVLTGDFYYAGQFVAVDHGLGVVSISMHMSEIIARQGQKVKAGEVIGLVGSTGRSTGPHLHLGMTVLGESVDALTLLNLTAEDKAAYAAAINNAPAAPAKKAATKTEKKQQTKKPAPSAAKSGKTTGRTGKAESSRGTQ